MKPRNISEALKMRDEAEAAVIEAEAALIACAKARGASAEHLEFLRAMFRKNAKNAGRVLN